MNNTIIATQKEFDLFLNKALELYNKDKQKMFKINNNNCCYVLKVKADKMNYKFEDLYFDSDFSNQMYNGMNTVEEIITKDFSDLDPGEDCTSYGITTKESLQMQIEYWLENSSSEDEDLIKEVLSNLIQIV